jgi:hypothetical protein
MSNKFIDEAESYEKMRDDLGRDQLDNFRLITSQLADWYIAIAVISLGILHFLVGGRSC